MLNDIHVPRFSYVFCHLIKPQSIFPSLLAPIYEASPISQSPRPKENSKEARPPIRWSLSFFCQNSRLNTDWSIRLGIHQRSVLRHIPNTQSERKHLCAFLPLGECGEKEKVTVSCEVISPLSVVGREHIIPPGTWVICEMLVFNSNFSTTWPVCGKPHKADIQAQVYFSTINEIANGNPKNENRLTLFIVKQKI